MTTPFLSEEETPPLAMLTLEERPPLELGMIYAAGRIGPKDLVAAHMWFNIAAMRGDREAAAKRQEVSREMSREEIAQALAWARAWLEAKAPVQG